MQTLCETATPERRDAARDRPPTGRAWLRVGMVSNPEATFNLREIQPPPRNILSASRVGPTSTRGGEQDTDISVMYRYLSIYLTQSTCSSSGGRLLGYPPPVRDTAKRRIGCSYSRHLNQLAKSICVNVGGRHREVSSQPANDSGVGAAIVVRGWESQPHAKHRQRCSAGEGPQLVGISKQTSRMLTRRNLH
jgi:hypothetical protein